MPRLASLNLYELLGRDIRSAEQLKSENDRNSGGTVTHELQRSNRPSSDALQTMLLSGLERARRESKFSDLIVKCKDREWKVHRIVMSSSSTYFDKLCSGDFKESHECIITLEDDDPDLVARMIKHLYGQSYFEGVFTLDEISEPQQWIRNVQIYALADKYGLNSLKQNAMVCQRCAQVPEWSACGEEFFTATELAYETTPECDRGMRDIMLEHIQDNKDEMCANEYFLGMIRRGGDIALDVVRLKLSSPRSRLRTRPMRFDEIACGPSGLR